MKRTAKILVSLGVLALPLPAWVHHSGAMFDPARRQTLAGTIRLFNWTNPHASFQIDVADPSGKVVTWAIEMGSPNNMLREGWKRTTLQPGDEVTVVVMPLRDGKPGGSYVSVTLADGTQLGVPPAGQAVTP